MFKTSCGEDVIDPVPQPPVKEEYLRARITIKENNQVTLQAFGNARGRGNYTWDGYPKKPYKIKFDEKQAVCGFPANKDWVLLSDYCDKSLLRTACMCDISEALQIDYPVRYRHVHLYLNGEYKGVYLLTDQIERKKHRVDIADDGFLFENDNYAWAVPPRKPDPHQVIWGKWKYFGRLFQDLYFKGVVKEEWEEFKPRIPLACNRYIPWSFTHMPGFMGRGSTVQFRFP